jgi:hypothetical protein
MCVLFRDHERQDFSTRSRLHVINNPASRQPMDWYWPWGPSQKFGQVFFSALGSSLSDNGSETISRWLTVWHHPIGFLRLKGNWPEGSAKRLHEYSPGALFSFRWTGQLHGAASTGRLRGSILVGSVTPHMCTPMWRGTSARGVGCDTETWKKPLSSRPRRSVAEYM